MMSRRKITYVKEPTDLQCGQAVLAMLCKVSVGEINKMVGTERETNLKQMFLCLQHYGIDISHERIEVKGKEQLPSCALLSLETPRCWHWSLYCDGVFYDPEHGVLQDFPDSKRKYYWEIRD